MERADGEEEEEVTITRVAVKKENLCDDIKEFAETAMNELLGWYGYENTRDELINRNCRSSHSGSNCSNLESPKSPDGCGWCGKTIEESTGLTSSNATFCSELCFSQSRRANFKKNKTCDWCKHVRHTVSYVDFQDGNSQLQFCSDKCLNQYKMHIFCRETRAHLELHPHPQNSTAGALITPDLWLRNCRSPEPSRRTPSPPPPPPPSPPVPFRGVATPPSPPPAQTSPLPLVAESKRNRLKAQRRTKKRSIPATVTCPEYKSPPNDVPQDLRVLRDPAAQRSPANKGENTPIAPVPIEQQENFKRLFDTFLPPPTVVVPYPIFLPLPLPIPIPIPIPMRKEAPVEVERKHASVQTSEATEATAEKGESNPMGRLLRKRKRICEPKQINARNRKLVNASSTN